MESHLGVGNVIAPAVLLADGSQFISNYDTSLPHKPLSPKDHLRREMTVSMLGN